MPCFVLLALFLPQSTQTFHRSQLQGLRGSDVHIESQQSGLVIRYRIDGMLHPQPVPPEIIQFQAAIISRLKIMARLNIAEKRLPQDGRMRLRIAGRQIDVRVSVIPMIHGEGIVMRNLDKTAMVFELRGLGMEEDMYAVFRKLITLPHGIILVTGPTGCGKTTTLYAALNRIVSEKIKILTVEDPIEYHLNGVNQTGVNLKAGMTFARGLRSFLRQAFSAAIIDRKVRARSGWRKMLPTPGTRPAGR